MNSEQVAMLNAKLALKKRFAPLVPHLIFE